MADLVLHDIRKSFGRTEVLHGVSTRIEAGSFVSLLGPSGCGKTTLLRIVAGLESVSAGRVEIAGEDVTARPPEARDIAMMFQSYALLPHLSVAGNVAFPLQMRRIGRPEERPGMVRAALDTVQLGALADRFPRQLSGGQQQRVALARALVSRPRVLLLDEPLSNLDARLREDMQVELIAIHERLKLTTVFVTHDQEEALSLSDRVILINDGKVEQEGTPKQIYDTPRTRFAADFLGASNVLAVTVRDDGHAELADGQALALAAPAPPGPAELAIRQEDVAILDDDDADGLAAEVAARVFLGARSRYVLRLAGQEVRALGPDRPGLRPGATVRLRLPPDRLRLLARP